MSIRGCSSFSGAKLRVWQSDVDGDHTSEALFDAYTFAHAFSASLQFLLIPPPWLITWKYAFLLNFGLHVLFEIVENTPFVIQFCRKTTPDTQYKGDSIVNSFGDLLTFVLVYFSTWATWNRIEFWTFAMPLVFISLHILLVIGLRSKNI